MVGVSASVNLSLHHKVQKFFSGTGWPRWSQQKGRKTVVAWCGGSVSCCYKHISQTDGACSDFMESHFAVESWTALLFMIIFPAMKRHHFVADTKLTSCFTVLHLWNYSRLVTVPRKRIFGEHFVHDWFPHCCQTNSFKSLKETHSTLSTVGNQPLSLILSWFTSGPHPLVIHRWTLSFVDLLVYLVLSWSTSVPHSLLIHQWVSFSRDPPLDLVLCWSTGLPRPFLIHQCSLSSLDPPVCLILSWFTSGPHSLVIHHWTLSFVDLPVYLVLSWSTSVPHPLVIHQWTSSSFDPLMNCVVSWSTTEPHALLIHRCTSSFRDPWMYLVLF